MRLHASHRGICTRVFRRFMSGGLMLLLAGSLPAPVLAEPDWGEAINTAGRQRMLTQRITRSYVQAGLGARTVLAREQLAASIRQFDSQHAALMQLQVSPEFNGLLMQVMKDWQPFRMLVSATPRRDQVGRLLELEAPLLDKCEQVVGLLEQHSGTPQGRLVNLSGRQRMLSQRLVKNYMLLAAGLASPKVLAQLDDDRVAFRRVLNTLLSERHYSVEIGQKLEDVADQWVWVESALDSMAEDHYPIIVADAGEKVLVVLEDLTRMYAQVEAAGTQQ